MQLDSPSNNQSAARAANLRACLVFGLLALVVYNMNLRRIGAGDSNPARYLPFAILGYGSVYLDPVAKVTAQGDDNPRWMMRSRNGHIVSLYPAVIPFLVTPLFIPAAVWLHARGWTDERMDVAAKFMEKLAASLIASTSVALMYLLLRRRANAGTAALVTVAFGFGTNTWMIASQALWEHGMGQLLLIIMLLLITGPATAARVFAAGAVCALMPFERPPNVMFAVPLGLYGLWWAGRRLPLLLAGAIIPSVPMLAYNLMVSGSIVGGYATRVTPSFFHLNLFSGMAGLLFSPARGLFVFSPFLLALPLGLMRSPADRPARWLNAAVCVAIVLQIALYSQIDWRGGCSWGRGS